MSLFCEFVLRVCYVKLCVGLSCGFVFAGLLCGLLCKLLLVSLISEFVGLCSAFVCILM